MPNDFNLDLEYSLESGENEMFDSFYRRVFPGLSYIETVTDLCLQKKGIDKLLHMENGQRISIDEKKRRVDYGDILLELWSVYENKKLGWLFTSYCHYVVYAVMPTRKVFILPMLLTRIAWKNNSNIWKERYKQISAKNKTYTTISIAIPSNILLLAISKEMEKGLTG